MKPVLLLLACVEVFLAISQAERLVPLGSEKAIGAPTEYEKRTMVGWQIFVSPKLLADEADAVRTALVLIEGQLRVIRERVPGSAVERLREVPLWISPEYPNTKPKAEYHPHAGWLRAHGRNPAMAKAVEFTNVRIFEAECRRMPALVLHELAHAYHHRVLGYDHAEVKAAFKKAKAGGKYDRVERQDSEGRKSMDRAYAMTNPQEYFAETTEAFFSRNDFYPFQREELKIHDPEMFALLTTLWTVPPPGSKAQ
jgi:hypothetical protein